VITLGMRDKAILKVLDKKSSTLTLNLAPAPITVVKKKPVKQVYYLNLLEYITEKKAYIKILSANVKKGYFPCIFIEDLYRRKSLKTQAFYFHLKRVFNKYPLLLVYENHLFKDMPGLMLKKHLSWKLNLPLEYVTEKYSSTVDTYLNYDYK